jgi:hypothetical protein
MAVVLTKWGQEVTSFSNKHVLCLPLLFQEIENLVRGNGKGFGPDTQGKSDRTIHLPFNRGVR